jgi:hypothetical protein
MININMCVNVSCRSDNCCSVCKWNYGWIMFTWFCTTNHAQPTLQRLVVKEGLALRLRWRAVGIIWFPRPWIGATSLEWWEFRRYQDGELLEYVHIPKEWPNLRTCAVELSTGPATCPGHPMASRGFCFKEFWLPPGSSSNPPDAVIPEVPEAAEVPELGWDGELVVIQHSYRL